MNERAQTNLDFALGVSILLVTIVAAMTFVPGLFDTVDEGRADADEVAANRIASGLVEEQLGHESQPGRIDVDCTRALFADDTVDYCGNDATDPVDNLRFEDWNSVNVTIVNRNGDRVCWDDPAGQLANESQSGTTCSLNLALGGSPTGSSDVAVTRRPVRIDGFDATVVVRAW